ncbi:CDP-glycerol glycerophosphotransferase family protein [Vibrio casei]|uniref:CDP-glycerol glycerophosphotransferase family protein n=1 Tax=Vibrio casei TaxID=673372 RepID=UPI00097E8A8C|nr:CDP-glycerol glycerophosphotransferase family protein [Vibrio casei]SJN37363.1 CDP-glycerol:poly(glycerophosphate) glycerophosphotransferase [Vibrio casei]
MNKNRYLKLRGTLFIKGALFSLLGFFIGRVKQRIVFNSEFNTEFNHNSKYLFLHFIKNHPEFDVRFVINNLELKEQLNQEVGPYFIDTYSLKNRFYILKAKTWVTSSLETPIGGFLQNYNRFVFHLGHGAPLKRIGRAEKYLNWKKALYYRLIKSNFSYFFSTSEAFSETWRACLNLKKEQVVIAGQARNEALFSGYVHYNDVMQLAKGKRHVLYAPTWRPFDDTAIFPFLDFDADRLGQFLQQNNCILHLRVHPNFESGISDKVKGIKNLTILSRSCITDINEILGQFDLLITDYSSIYVDYLLTQKPMLFLPYDYSIYKNKIGFTIPYQQATPGPKPKTQKQFLQEVECLLNDDKYYAQERKDANNWLNVVQNQQAQQNAELIFQLLKS